MEELNIKHGPFIVVRRIIGVINLICAGLWLVVNLGDLKIFDWIYFTVFMFSGGALLTNGFGSEKSYIIKGDSFLRIKWINRFRTVVIKESEIIKIGLTRFKIILELKERNPLILRIYFLERDQKKEVYDYFIQYAKEKNLEFSMEYH